MTQLVRDDGSNEMMQAIIYLKKNRRNIFFLQYASLHLRAATHTDPQVRQ